MNEFTVKLNEKELKYALGTLYDNLSYGNVDNEILLILFEKLSKLLPYDTNFYCQMCGKIITNIETILHLLQDSDVIRWKKTRICPHEKNMMYLYCQEHGKIPNKDFKNNFCGYCGIKREGE